MREQALKARSDRTSRIINLYNLYPVGGLKNRYWSRPDRKVGISDDHLS